MKYDSMELYAYKYVKRKIRQLFYLVLIANISLFCFMALAYVKYEKEQESVLNAVNMLRVKLEQEQSDEEANNEAALSENDMEYIARVCMVEAGDNYEACLAVAQCIHDRAYLWNMKALAVLPILIR